MFELFAMSLREYWNEVDDSDSDVSHSIAELQDVLSEHFGREIRWDEPELDPDKQDEEISVDVIDDRQLSALHAIAAKLELDGNLDGLELDPENPWDCDVFERLEDELDSEDSSGDPEKFPHVLSIGNSFECVCIPVDLPFVAQINVNNDEDDEDDEEECHCNHGDDEECCCCDDEDENSLDISSVPALRRELDMIGEALKLNPNVNIDEIDVDFDEEDPYRFAKICWYIMNAKLNDAIKSKQPMIIRFCDDDEYDDLDDEDDVE